MRRRDGMKGEKRKEEIVVIDEGIDMEAVVGPTGFCCYGAFSAIRG